MWPVTREFATKEEVTLKVGIAVYSDDPETVWNAFRLANIALKNGDRVRAFLVGKGVKSESLDTEKYAITSLMQDFVDNGGEILACTTCMKIHSSDGSALCPFSSINQLYSIIKESDKIISF